MTEKQCGEAIVQYLDETNRPYSDKEIHDNMHKPIGKTAFNKLLVKLHADGKLGHRMNGKFKLYWSRQDQYETISKEDMVQLDGEIMRLKDEEKSLKDNLKSQQYTLGKLRSRPTLDELKAQHEETKTLLNEKKEKLSRLEDGGEVVDPKLRENTIKKLKAVKAIWRDRNNKCMDMVDQFMDEMGKKEKQVFEIMGMESDHDAGGSTYKEFCQKIKGKDR